MISHFSTALRRIPIKYPSLDLILETSHELNFSRAWRATVSCIFFKSRQAFSPISIFVCFIQNKRNEKLDLKMKNNVEKIIIHLLTFVQHSSCSKISD